MILAFSTQLNGKATNFVEKIWDGLLSKGLCNSEEMWEFENQYQNEFSDNLDFSKANISKLHTIREDPKDRWKVGMLIDFFINVRTKKMFRFAPKLPVIEIQHVLMTYNSNDLIQISIDDKELFGHTERLQFAINDGFDTWEDFFNYFYPKIKAAPKGIYTPKLIHWTDKKY